METFNFPYHKYSVDYPESGFKMELGGSYRYNAEPSAPDQRIFKLYFDTMLRYEAKYTKSGIIPSGNVNGDVWVDTGTQNLFPHSENLASWATYTQGATLGTQNTVTAPDGTLTAEALVETSINGEHYSSRSTAYGSTGKYTLSDHLFRAANTRNAILSLFSTGNSHSAWYDLVTGVATAITTSPGTSVGMVSKGGGWWRCWLTANITNTTSPGQRLTIASSSGSPVYTGNSVGAIYSWGRQLEKSEGMGTYLPTTTSAVSTTGINKGYRFSNGVWVPTTNPSKLNLFSNPEINLGLLEDFYLRHKMWKKFIYPHPIYGDLAVRFSRPLILPKGYTDGNGTVEPFELEFIEVPGGL